MGGIEGEAEPDAGDELAAGRLLIASPLLGDPNFARSVIVLLNVDSDGALGVILNRPSEVPVVRVLDRWADLTGASAVIFSGGPVEPEGALAVGTLAGDTPPPEGWRPVFGRVGLVDLDGPLGDYRSLRVYAGYAGWSDGQLEAEVAEGAWHVVPSRPGDLETDDPELLWRRVLRRQPSPLDLLVSMPADATWN